MSQWLSKNLINFSLASFFNDFCHEMSTAILPSFIAQLVGPELAPSILGTIEGCADVASTGMKLLSGWLADRIRFYKPILVLGYGLTPVFVALLGTTQSVLYVLIYRMVTWMGRGIREPMRDTWIAKITKGQFYGRAFGLHRASDTFGAIVGPLCVTVLLQQEYSLSAIFLVAAIPGILSVLPLLFLTESPKPVRPERTSFIADIKQMPADFKFFVAVMFVFGLGNFHQILLIYRIQQVLPEHATMWGVAFYAFFNIMRAFGEFGMGYLSDFKSRPLLLATFGFGLFGVGSLGLMTTSENLAVWLLLCACIGVSVGTVKALEKAHAATLLPEDIRGTGMGVLQALDGVGDLISSSLVGMLWSFYSPAVGLGYAAVMSGLAMGMMLIRRGR